MPAVLHASAYPYSQNIDVGILDGVSVAAKKNKHTNKCTKLKMSPYSKTTHVAAKQMNMSAICLPNIPTICSKNPDAVRRSMPVLKFLNIKVSG